jgi:hypothetical protein
MAAAVLTSAGRTHAQEQAKLTPEQWKQDLRFLTERLAVQHPNAFRRVRKEDFDAAVQKLDASMPNMTEDEIVVGMMKIIALVQDGHTNILPRGIRARPVFPVRMYLFEDGLYVKSAPQKHADLVGAKVKRIGDLDAGEALRRASEIVAADNEMGRKDNAPLMLAIPQILVGLKIIGDQSKLRLDLESKGTTSTVELAPEASVQDIILPPADWKDASPAPGSRPLYLRDPANAFWFEYDRDRKIVYVQQNQVANKADETVEHFYKGVLDVVAANPVEKLVIDLRNNGGGNNGLNRAVVLGLIKSKMDERGKLFIITGRATFSAAQNLVSDLENLTNAIFVGEPTGGHPNHYGDARPVELPNSKLVLRISTIYWQDVDPRDNRPWTAPEIAAVPTFSDYVKGIDPAMKAVLEYKPGTSIRDLIRAAGTAKDPAPILAQIERIAREPQSRYLNVESDVNRLGYDLLRRNRSAEAVEVFKLNSRLHPASANVFDSLGDGLAAAGNKDEAIKAYMKALSIDPSYPSSLESLKKLRGQ